MDGDYLPITYGDENPDTQFLVHNSISRYVSKLPSMGIQARAIKLALPGHTPYAIANIHRPFSRDQREKMDEWLAELPEVRMQPATSIADHNKDAMAAFQILSRC